MRVKNKMEIDKIDVGEEYKFNCNEMDLSIEYLDAIEKVAEVHAERKLIYGDIILNSPLEYDIWNIYGKTQRIIKLFKDGNNHYERLEDSIIDCCNYCFFSLMKLKSVQNKK